MYSTTGTSFQESEFSIRYVTGVIIALLLAVHLHQLHRTTVTCVTRGLQSKLAYSGIFDDCVGVLTTQTCHARRLSVVVLLRVLVSFVTFTPSVLHAALMNLVAKAVFLRHS
jgi:hypothetical protein